jgi:hypothetical protein
MVCFVVHIEREGRSRKRSHGNLYCHYQQLPFYLCIIHLMSFQDMVSCHVALPECIRHGENHILPLDSCERSVNEIWRTRERPTKNCVGCVECLGCVEYVEY